MKTKAIGWVEVNDSLQITYKNGAYSHTQKVLVDSFDEPLVNEQRPPKPTNHVDIAHILVAAKLEDEIDNEEDDDMSLT